jgi:hypothetical protein
VGPVFEDNIAIEHAINTFYVEIYYEHNTTDFFIKNIQTRRVVEQIFGSESI